MEPWKKQLRKIPESDRSRILSTLVLIFRRDVEALHRLRLKGYEHIYRVRVGNYRILYHDDGRTMTLKSISKRDENTYKGL